VAVDPRSSTVGLPIDTSLNDRPRMRGERTRRPAQVPCGAIANRNDSDRACVLARVFRLPFTLLPGIAVMVTTTDE
jgi:hypothetical protein